MKRNIKFAIRAKMDSAVKQTVSEINETDWRLVVYEDGTVSDTEWTARVLHVMKDVSEAFFLVVQRTLIVDESEHDEAAKHADGLVQTRIDFQDQSLHKVDEVSAQCDKYVHRAIATNKDKDTNAQIVWWYDHRAGTFRHLLYAIASKIVHHSREITIKVSHEHMQVLKGSLLEIQTCSLD